MAFEDLLHPLLSAYIGSPQWVKSSLGRIYAALPLAARRGAHYRRFGAEAELRDGARLAQLSQAKLAAALRWSIETVPAYRRYAGLLAQLGDPLAVLRQLPLVSKEEIKRDSASYLSQAMPPGRRMETFTGGSTATPLKFYLHKGVSRPKEYAFMDDFHARVGLLDGDVVLALRGRTVPSAGNADGKLWMYEPIKRQLILSCDHLERVNMPEYMRAILRWKPTCIQAYPSAIYPVARWLKEHPDPAITARVRGILLYSENVYSYQMDLLKEVFDCPVLTHYGHSERVLMAASMPGDERCFFWPQYGHMELVDEAGRPVTRPGVIGELVGTGFDNRVMPFVRYRTGDLAVLSAHGHPRLPGYPAVERIEGRLQEFLVCKDQRLVSICTMGAAHFGELAQVDALQYEQRVAGHFLLKVVVGAPLSAGARASIVKAVVEKTQGGCTAEVVEVAAIPRTPSGKHKMLVQHLDLARFYGAAHAE